MMGAFQEQVSKKRRSRRPYTDFSNEFTSGSNYSVRPSDAEWLRFLVEACSPEARPEAFSIALKQGVAFCAAEEERINK